MSLNDALSIAMAGLRANQAAMSLVSSNVANAETPGYVKKTINQVATNAGYGSSVTIVGVNRELDQYIQAQLRTETSGAGYASLRSNFLQQLQGMYGNPGSTGTLEAAFAGLTTAVQALATSADSQSARIGVVNAAAVLSQQLNSMTQGIQSLRGAAETDIRGSVDDANALMKQIATINNSLAANPAGGTSTDSSTAALLDQRDQYITKLSGLMDIRVTTNGANQVTVFTGSGVQLVGQEAATLSFNAQGTVTPNTEWSADPSKSKLGSVIVSFANGGSIDLTATGAIKSGKIAAYTELRDKTLVEAQDQLDQFAAQISSALSDKTTAATITIPTAGSQTATLDVSGMQSGNVAHLSYTDASNVKHQISLMRVDNPSVLPLSNNVTADPSDEVYGIDFSASPASIVAQINTALNGRLTVTGASLSALTVQNNPTLTTLTAASVTTTALPGSLTSGNPQVALFTDTGSSYTGAISGSGSQITGLAGRLTVNSALLADPSKLVLYGPTTAAGDTTRVDFIMSRLTKATFQYTPSDGVGSASAPFKGTLLSYMQQFTSAQGAQASAAKQLASGQDVVLATLQGKMTTTSGVNIDDEMAHLLSLQNAYSANARVMSTVNDMYKTLMQAF
ncbi:flagellar hook-associated protein FlgK [Tardiphaga sp. vice352]|uniref:flagellar hook-associated protein FlgK n=1 Tax=unclassified Tardiphaga TaxID=2631404 RepID=UPI0011644957|nr:MULTISPECIES: flagellar hook-associated protein FlgK [unclassified Tardiphaga]QDM17899.1 flagellar hook-associated protein FlgK [Tardiphaga sp. vice278]QDM22959.1 flagellar hook-associated protein FlgK [Tardiphaga sp. vice154]QDM28118.1 flagellar hook-associated protein FlgK [Tardiphaga sp. vice304]QDM33261.1 flagellar hook-associated protein FlgK [Tardiphaga sp. vice352]